MFIQTNRRKPVSLMLVVLLIGAFLGMFPAPAGGEAEKTRPWFEDVQKPGESSAQKGKWGAAPFKASSSGLPLYRALGADDNVPGVPLPPSPVIGTLDEYTDFIDVYSVQLNPGDVLSASITGPAGTDFDLYLFAPGTIDVYYADPVAGAAGGSYPDSFSYTVPAGGGGTYYLTSATLFGSGLYSISYTINKTSITNDFQGDRRSDCIAFYDYGSATAGLWVFISAASPSGVAFSPSLVWKSATGGIDLSKIKAVSGDFDGDEKVDVIGLYNYGGTSSGLLLWKSNGGSYSGPINVFFSSYWAWNNTKLVSGDFNADGKDELFAFYTYGGTNTGVFVFEQNADGTFKYPRRVFFSPYWDWNNTRLLSVKDGLSSKVVAAYDYGGTTTGLWAFELNPDGTLKYPVRYFYSPYWDFKSTSFLTGDVDDDGATDVIAFYNYGGSTTGTWVFYQNPDGTFTYPLPFFLSPYWNYSASTFIPGDFNGDGYYDAAAVYDYGGGTTGIWVFSSNGWYLSYPTRVYLTPYWDNARTRWVMPY
ncbi:MAG: VCBS repeat-containing protein [Firmicutes bacterium]|nr:VCBS repeat-containing protein [Bacillota bacterium]